MKLWLVKAQRDKSQQRRILPAGISLHHAVEVGRPAKGRAVAMQCQSVLVLEAHTSYLGSYLPRYLGSWPVGFEGCSLESTPASAPGCAKSCLRRSALLKPTKTAQEPSSAARCIRLLRVQHSCGWSPPKRGTALL